ncbi:sulfurtransferase TusA family protein [Kineosporia sp. J2-2]|uniref:Sulfurtransferase TusA family protein n=1 Tax=Kineosporia corallincola TaxID=2835133 RepID=A0ABS5TJJ7_9ACTN|nr:sulfurtransferase TusA family protein [Kineosporia corallincola]MBT0771008.1 sulfurtransferase TusA family protein [Kineosporia corallincola]
MTDDEEPADPHGVDVDARELRCPLPIIRLAAAARLVPPGTVVTVLSTDPAAEPDIAAWCRMRGAQLLGQDWTADATGQFLRSRVRVLSGS